MTGPDREPSERPVGGGGELGGGTERSTGERRRSERRPVGGGPAAVLRSWIGAVVGANKYVVEACPRSKPDA